MAQTGYTPISLYYSTTAAASPTSGNLVDGELAINIQDEKLYFKNAGGTVKLLASAAGASGDVVGPASATDNAIVRFDGTTGKLVQNSVVTIADSTGDISGVGVLNATTIDTTNLEVTNIKAKDGTASATIANSTGVMTIGSSVLTTTDINGGTIDGTAIGGSTPAAGAFTTLSASGNITASNGIITTGSTTGLSLATSGGTQAQFLNAASAVNYLQFSGAGAGADVYLQPNGSDTNVGLFVGSKGTDSVLLHTGGTSFTVQVAITHTASANRYITLTGSNGGAPVIGTSAGDLAFSPAGTEGMRIDSSGNVGIGTSSPQAGIKLDVHGNVAVRNGNYLYLTEAANTAAVGIKSPASSVMAFETNNIERMRIDSSGNVGINSTSSITPGGYVSKMYVAGTETGSTGCGIGGSLPNSAAGSVYVSNSVTSAGTGWYHFVGQSGNGSSITTNNILIYGNGDVQNTNNSYGAISDIRFKENIVDASPKLADLMKVKVCNFNIIGDTQKQIGVIAQELERVFPAMVQEIVDRDESGYDLGTTTKSVKYSVFVPILIKAVQEQQKIIETLSARIAVLEVN